MGNGVSQGIVASSVREARIREYKSRLRLAAVRLRAPHDLVRTRAFLRQLEGYHHRGLYYASEGRYIVKAHRNIDIEEKRS